MNNILVKPEISKEPFYKNMIIRHQGEFWKCILHDWELACFGRLTINEDGSMRTSYQKMFIVSQKELGGFEYEDVTRLMPD